MSKESKESKETNKCSQEAEKKAENENIIILHNDCMIELQKMEDESIDCVITDPPYFIDKLDNNWNTRELDADVKNSHIKHLPK
jgi:site-specific DNA-methyltransferase (adenine-specific)